MNYWRQRTTIACPLAWPGSPIAFLVVLWLCVTSLSQLGNMNLPTFLSVRQQVIDYFVYTRCGTLFGLSPNSSKRTSSCSRRKLSFAARVAASTQDVRS